MKDIAIGLLGWFGVFYLILACTFKMVPEKGSEHYVVSYTRKNSLLVALCMSGIIGIVASMR